MHVSVNGVRLFFDVEGAKFVPDGPFGAVGTICELRAYRGPDAPERAMALLREFILRRKINFLPRLLNGRRHPLGLNT